MKPLFGTLNNRVVKALSRNVPRITRLVEPFGDGGTYAMTLEKIRPKSHLLNIEDPIYFEVMRWIQNSKKSEIAGFDWISSEETFAAVLAISAVEGPELFYRWYYLKAFGSMAMGADADEAADPAWDWATTGDDLKPKLSALALMKVGLKGVEIANEDPLSTLAANSGSGNFLLLLPQRPEHVEAVEGRISGLGAQYFYARKIADNMEAADKIGAFGAANVGLISLPGIMVSDGIAVWNFEGTTIEPLDAELIPMGR